MTTNITAITAHGGRLTLIFGLQRLSEKSYVHPICNNRVIYAGDITVLGALWLAL